VSAPIQTPEWFVGRHEELRRVDEILTAARKGCGDALVLRGEPGVGKTALLDQARTAAADLRTLDGWGSQFEAELPFAGLHQLCLPILGHLGDLPERHREALRVAFGLVAGSPDQFRVGAATVDLLAAAAVDTPLLCVVDDAQWLDAASMAALTFAARRVGAEPIAMLFAVRLPELTSGLDSLPGIVLDGLDAGDARALLARTHLTLDEQVRERIIAEARGNPLALRELPRAGGYAAPGTATMPSRLENGFASRLGTLPNDVRLLLTVASADPTGAPSLLWAAARRLGLDLAKTTTAATETGLVEFTDRIRFCHPLARSAVYRAASPHQRRIAHQALAEVTADPDRRAWHHAEAASGPDADIADALDRCASRALERGGMVAAAAFIERAAALTLEPATRTGRTIRAAQAHLDAGAPETAGRLLTAVERATLDTEHQAELDILLGRLAFTQQTDSHGPVHMLRAAQALAAVNPERSRDILLDALEMGLLVGRANGVMETVLTHARAIAPPAREPDLLDALILLDTEGHRVAVPLLREILGRRQEPIWTRRPALASILAAELWDPHTHSEIAAWIVDNGRRSGSPWLLRIGLAQIVTGAALAGDLPRAFVAVAEEEAIAEAIGAPAFLYPRLYLAAIRGRRQDATEVFRTATATQAGAGHLIANVHWARAVFHNGNADYSAAMEAARQATAHEDLFLAGAALPELVEAATRCGESTTAENALTELLQRTEPSGTPAALGIAAYARALVTGDERDYQEAVAHLDQTPLLPFRGRAHLLYGEWLRRQGRRRDSRNELHIAHGLLHGAGVEAFARRAMGELRATGHTARARKAHNAYHDLTAQETAVARLAADGATTNEIAARLLLSPRTIDAHLRGIFGKLGITSRRQLRDHPRLES
jgi:DNA-binding CsgD family transcriptional regulator